MNLEIKFRWLDINWKWHIWNLAILKQANWKIPAWVYISNKAWMPFVYNVNPETIGQYIWLNDIKEKEIFTWDIVEIYYDYVWEVVFNDEDATFRVNTYLIINILLIAVTIVYM